MNAKIRQGQFYTRSSPFVNALFFEWIKSIPDLENKSIVEPFAGSNNLINLFNSAVNLQTSLKISNTQWSSYDIDPEAQGSNNSDVEIKVNDSLKNMPKGDIAVTNPPYLAKNSAKRMKLDVDFNGYNDLWELSVSEMLKNFDYVVAIIPESFINRRIFTSRLFGVVSLTSNLFDDTGFPVCLAMWGKEDRDDYFLSVQNKDDVYRMSEVLKAEQSFIKNDLQIVFNDKNGLLGLYAVDSTSGPTIRFVKGSDIDSKNIKPTSRAITRISVPGGDLSLKNLDETIETLNKVLERYRYESNDFLLTNFKSLRKDGVYRRRLDWRTATKIIQTVVKPINQDQTLF